MLHTAPVKAWSQHCRSMHCVRDMARLLQCRSLRLSIICMAKPWRPDVNDIDRLSKGDGAKKRGTGNFNIPHRLNSEERPVYEAAKKKGYLQVRGTGYRKGRKGNPLPNVYRQWCDAKAAPCIVIEQDTSGCSRDVVVVDLATLRLLNLSKAVALCNQLAEATGAIRLPPDVRPLEAVPFNTLPVDLPQTVYQMLYQQADAAAAAAAAPTPEQLRAAEMAVLQQADNVRQLKATGLSNSSPEVQQQVQDLLKLKAGLQELLNSAAAAEAAVQGGSTHQNGSSLQSSNGMNSSSNSSKGTSSSGSSEHGCGQVQTELNTSSGSDDADAASAGSSSSGSSSRRQVLPEDHPFVNAAIWQIPVMPLFYEGDRPVAKELAKTISSALAGVAAKSR